MSNVTINIRGVGAVEVPAEKRLILAMVDEGGADPLHACGGNAKCTTCAVSFHAGEPEQFTTAEKEKLDERGLSGLRLSCQILAAEGMDVEIQNHLEGSGRSDSGSRPEDAITPEPVWLGR